MQLLGRVTGGAGDRLSLAPDLHECLAKSDQIEVDLLKQIDNYIEARGIEAPARDLPEMRDGYSVEPVRELDLAAQGIHTILWAQGYAFDFSMVRVPVTDTDGYPLQQRGVTVYPGLYFIGLPWLSKFQSGLILGVGEDAEYITAKIR
jgi:putative flavoprotein involved in K+ transport